MKFKYAEQDLAIYGHDVNADISQMKQRIAQEYEAFTHTLNDWAKLKEQELQAKKAAMAEKIHKMDHKLKVDFQLLEHRLSHHRECLETLMRNIKRTQTSYQTNTCLSRNSTWRAILCRCYFWLVFNYGIVNFASNI